MCLLSKLRAVVVTVSPESSALGVVIGALRYESLIPIGVSRRCRFGGAFNVFAEMKTKKIRAKQKFQIVRRKRCYQVCAESFLP